MNKLRDLRRLRSSLSAMVTPAAADRIVATLKESQCQGFALREQAMQLLSELPGYDWSGVYRLEGEHLILDAYVGDPTEHTRINVGVGVCGVAVQEGRNQVIGDVRELDNYLACSVHTRSEIVVLIRRGFVVIGQIDIDSHRVGAFDASDECLLTQIGELLATRWENG